MRVDFGIAERWKAGRSCWASGRLTVEFVTVDSMRCEAAGFAQACLRRPGRMIEAIAIVVSVQRRVQESWSGRKMQYRDVKQMSTMPRMRGADVPPTPIGQRSEPGNPVTADLTNLIDLT